MSKQIYDEYGDPIDWEHLRFAYNRSELEAYAGDYADDYDLEAIEAEAREWDTEFQTYVWKVRGPALTRLFAKHLKERA